MLDSNTISVFWFRRDLRLFDNRGLYEALKGEYPVLPIFIFDPTILNSFEKGENAQVEFILLQIERLNKELADYGGSVYTDYCTPSDFYKKLSDKYTIDTVYTNEDYELSTIKRDKDIEQQLAAKGIKFRSFKDQVIFSKNDILKEDKTPYTIFTPYSKRWMLQLSANDLDYFESELLLQNLHKTNINKNITIQDLGFKNRNIPFPSNKIDLKLISEYDKQRDFPAIHGTSQLGIHLRFGTTSIRNLVAQVKDINQTFLNELIWRDFYQYITYHFPRICQGYSFKMEYDNITWLNNEKDFKCWCSGQTGYPLVDAGMRELNSTGFMHNRVRMVVASFLTKHLLIDWRWGEAYFANKLLDFDFAANNGGWQWAAGSGCDAVPYFRVFNPQLQTEKFDKNELYIKKWIPEYKTNKYPDPIIDHKFARLRAIETYKECLSNK